MICHPGSALLPMASPPREVAVGVACEDVVIASVDLTFGARTHVEEATQYRFGVTETAFVADVEHKAIEVTGSHLVRFHEVGDKIGSRIDGPVRSTWVVLSPRFLEDVVSETPFWREPFREPFVAPPLPILGELHRFLARAKAGGSALWAQETLSVLLPRLLAARLCEDRCRRPLATSSMLKLARDAESLLGAAFPDPCSLSELAQRLGVSASYLARAYRAATGGTLHKRIARQRMSLALCRLAAGANDLTTLALELGYSSHSHFSAEFKRHLGVPPSQFRLNTQM